MTKRQFTSGQVPPLLSLQGISKTFEGVRALEDVSLNLFPGEILGLVGDNGAGKSTLIKILAGVNPPDRGTVFIDGKAVDFRRYGVKEARRLGIETVFQDRSVGEKQPLWRNVFVGRPLVNRWGFIRTREEKRATLEILRRHVGLRGAGIDAGSRVRTLSGGERQGLAIGRAMHFDARVLILDEPTTALSLKEVEKVLDFVSRFVGKDKACIYISHNMGHVHRIAHRMAFMDRGRVKEVRHRGELTIESLGAALLAVSAEQT